MNNNGGNPRESNNSQGHTVYPKKYAHGFVVLCFVVVMQSFIMNSHEVFIHIHQGCFAGTGAIVRLPQCQWSKPDGYGKISQCITTTKHSKAKTVCIFLGIYCNQESIYAVAICDYIRHGNEFRTEISHDILVELQPTWNCMCNIPEHLSVMHKYNEAHTVINTDDGYFCDFISDRMF